MIAVAFSWKVSFVLIMIVGLVWAFIWFKFVKERPAQTEDTPAMKAAVQSHEQHIPMTFYLKQKTVLFTAFAFFAYNYILFFFLTWFPSYLVKERGLSIEFMSVVTVIPWILGFIGLAAGGMISDYVYKKTAGKGVLFSRKVILVTCLFASAVLIGFAGLVTTAVSAVILVALSVFFLYITGSIYWAVIHDVVDQRNVGSVGGFMHFLANTAGIIGPALTGFIADKSGSFSGAFLLAGGLAVLASAAVIRFVRPIIIQTVSEDKKDTIPYS